MATSIGFTHAATLLRIATCTCRVISMIACSRHSIDEGNQHTTVTYICLAMASYNRTLSAYAKS
jgi:hypothetical protein